MNKSYKQDTLMLATWMREMAEDIEHEVEQMRNDDRPWEPDLHRAEAKRAALSLWRLAARFRRVPYGKE